MYVCIKVWLITQQVEGPLQSFIKSSDQKTYGPEGLYGLNIIRQIQSADHFFNCSPDCNYSRSPIAKQIPVIYNKLTLISVEQVIRGTQSIYEIYLYLLLCDHRVGLSKKKSVKFKLPLNTEEGRRFDLSLFWAAYDVQPLKYE